MKATIDGIQACLLQTSIEDGFTASQIEKILKFLFGAESLALCHVVKNDELIATRWMNKANIKLERAMGNRLMTIAIAKADVSGSPKQFVPVTVYGEHSWAFGFMREQTAEEVLDNDTTSSSQFARAVIEVLDDINKESVTGVYDFCGVKTLLLY